MAGFERSMRCKRGGSSQRGEFFLWTQFRGPGYRAMCVRNKNLQQHSSQGKRWVVLGVNSINGTLSSLFNTPSRNLLTRRRRPSVLSLSLPLSPPGPIPDRFSPSNRREKKLTDSATKGRRREGDGGIAWCGIQRR